MFCRKIQVHSRYLEKLKYSLRYLEKYLNQCAICSNFRFVIPDFGAEIVDSLIQEYYLKVIIRLVFDF